MKHELTEGNDGWQALRISAEWAEVSADYDDVFAAYARANVGGFRPGRVPRPVIEQRFRNELRSDFVTRCGRRLVGVALRERDLRSVGPIPLTAIRFEPRAEFAFTAEYVPVPRLALPDYLAAPLKTSTADERRDELSRWLLDHTEWEVPEPLIRRECEREGPAEPGSLAWLDAAERVKLAQILDQIAEAEGIEAGDREVSERIAKVSAERGLTPDELRRQLGEEGANRLLSLLRAEQTFVYLLEANPTKGSDGSCEREVAPDREVQQCQAES